jgi:hypothetical protein
MSAFLFSFSFSLQNKQGVNSMLPLDLSMTPSILHHDSSKRRRSNGAGVEALVVLLFELPLPTHTSPVTLSPSMFFQDILSFLSPINRSFLTPNQFTPNW